jgi:signal transduction histidine kinase
VRRVRIARTALRLALGGEREPEGPPVSERPPQTTVVLDADRRVRAAGAQVDRLLGRTAGDVIGSRLERVPRTAGHGRLEVVWPDRSVHALDYAAAGRSPAGTQLVALCAVEPGAAEPRRRDVKHALMADLRAPERDPFALIDARLAAALGADRVGVFESAGPARPLVLRAGAGWADDAIGRATAPSAADTPVGRALASLEPVIIRDLRRAPPAAPALADVVSGVEVAIRPHRSAWGVLGAYSTHRRRFSPDEVDVLTAVAELLALSIDRTVVEGRTRARIAQLLHDEALQSMLAARQYLASAGGDESRASAARDAVQRAIRELRAVVGDVHPVASGTLALRPAIAAAIQEPARRAGLRTVLEIDPDAGGGRASLLLSLARELAANAAEHAQATELRVALRRAGDRIVLEVADDGCGMEPERVEQALAEGHIGLASAAARVAALGGTLSVDSTPGEGTRVVVELPASERPDLAAGGAGTGAPPGA